MSENEKIVVEAPKEAETVKNVETDNKGYFKYWIFVTISAVIGFFTLLFLTKAALTVSTEKGIINFTDSMSFITWIVAIVGTALFILISLLFKKQLIKIYFSEIFMYLYMGVLTTAVNIISFQAILTVVGKNSSEGSFGWMIAEVIAFIIAIIFAFITNKIFVFKSLSFVFALLAKEFLQFAGARVVTELINFGIMWVMIEMNHMNETLTKVLASIIVIIINYIFSKFIIFKKKENNV